MDRPPDVEEKPREPVTSEAERTSEIAGGFQIHSRKRRITRQQSPDPNS